MPFSIPLNTKEEKLYLSVNTSPYDFTLGVATKLPVKEFEFVKDEFNIVMEDIPFSNWFSDFAFIINSLQSFPEKKRGLW